MNSDNRKPFGGWGPLQGGNEEAAPYPHQQDKWEVILGLLWVNIASEWGGGGVGAGWAPPGGFLICLGRFLIRPCRLRAMEGEVRAELSIQPSPMLSLLSLWLPESQRKSKAETLGSSQGAQSGAS